MSPEILPCTMPLKISPEILPYAMPLKISPETMPPDICRKLQPRREGRKEEMEIPPRREGRKEEMAIDMLQPETAPWEEMVATMLPFPTLILVDNNDLKSLALYVDVAGLRTLVAPEFAILIGGDTSLSTLRSGRFRPASEDRRRSYRSNRDRFKKSNTTRL